MVPLRIFFQRIRRGIPRPALSSLAPARVPSLVPPAGRDTMPALGRSSRSGYLSLGAFTSVGRYSRAVRDALTREPTCELFCVEELEC